MGDLLPSLLGGKKQYKSSNGDIVAFIPFLHHVCSPQYCHRIRFSEIKYCGQKMCFLPTIFLDNGLPVICERVRYTVNFVIMLTTSATYGKMFLDRKAAVDAGSKP